MIEANWHRKGRFIIPPTGHSWWQGHAQAATPLVLEPHRWRIFFAARDNVNRRRILYVDVDPLADMRILDQRFEPVLELGSPGCFDSAGQAPSCVLRVGADIWLYYLGMHLRRDVPYGLAVGLAISRDGGEHFERLVPGPVMSTGPRDPFFVAAPFVELKQNGEFEAWYMSGIAWKPNELGELDPWYDLKRAFSADGLYWRTSPSEGLSLDGDQAGLTRPWVVQSESGRVLFYSARGAHRFRESDGQSYRNFAVMLDHTEQPVGQGRAVTFLNPPEVGDWDYEMQAYASIARCGNEWIMFYNGDQFGRTGVGWAVYKPTNL